MNNQNQHMMMTKQIEEQIGTIPRSVSDWLSSIKSGSFMDVPLFRFCRSATREFSLDATSLSLDLHHMLGTPITLDEKKQYTAFFDRHQDPETGFFHEPFCMEELGKSQIDRVIEMSGTYLGFQVGGIYSLLNAYPGHPFSFYRDFISPGTITGYLDKMPWKRSPWGAGGWLDAVSTMLTLNVNMGYEEYRPALNELLDWVYSRQNPEHGFWGSDEIQGKEGLVNGAYHLLRGSLFLHNRKFRYHQKIADTIIDLVQSHPLFKTGAGEACHDLDTFYLLLKTAKEIPGYRTDKIKEICIERLLSILGMQNSDGAFSFYPHRAHEVHNYYAVSKGVKGESDIQGTVFYLTAIKALLEIIDPDFPLAWRYSITHG